MKKKVRISIISLAIASVFSMGLIAQEKTEITLQVKKDGKVVQDTTYQFEDDAKAKHAVKMMEVLSGDNEHTMKYNYHMSHGDPDHSKAMVFISKDGKKTEMKEFHGDTLVWFSDEEVDGDQMHIIKKKMVHGEHGEGENVVIMKRGDGETIDIFIEKDEDGNIMKKKQVKVMISGDEDGTWHVDSKELKDVDEDVYIISGDDVEVELKEILEDLDGETVKVIVVKTKTR